MSELSPQWSRVISELHNDPRSSLKDHRNLLQDATLGVAVHELNQLESQHARKSAGWKALQKMKPLLNVLDGFAVFAGNIASLDPHGIASIVIGSFRIVIQLASGCMSEFEKISSSFGYIHNELGRLLAHEKRFEAQPSKRLNNALYEVFKAYWAFFEDVYLLLYSVKHHRPKGLGSHFKAFITGHVAEVGSHIDGFKELCDTANKEIQLASEQRRDHEIAMLQEENEKILTHTSALQNNYFQEQCRQFKAWIAPFDMNEKMKTLLKQRTLGTGSWIVEDKSFISWLDGKSSIGVKTRSVLWLTAGPGFGKSSLAAFLADHLRRTVTTGVAYFSVDTTSNEKETSIVPALLRTVLDQLFADDPVTNEPHFEIRQSTIRNAGAFRLTDIGPYLSVLKETVREQSKPTTIIIDALDQCPQDQTNQYQLEELLSAITSLPSACKILLMSRPHPWFEDEMGDVMAKLPCPKYLTKDDIKHDISAYVLGALDKVTKDKRCKWNDDFRDELEGQIIKHSEGMFKWTELVVKDLSTLKAMDEIDTARATLEGVPHDLEEIYQRALEDIAKVEDDEEKRQVSRILQWVLRNYRQQLRVKELSAALAIKADGPSSDVRDLLDRHLSDLVYVDFETDIIRMTHHTATEFLTASPRYQCADGFQLVPDQLAEIDLDILLVCLSFWNDPDRQFLDATPVGDEAEELFEEVLRGYDATEYSCIGLVHHLSQVAEAQLFPEELESALGCFFRLDQHQNLLRWLQMFCYLRFPNRRGANEAYSAIFEALRDADPAVHRPLQSLLDDKYSDIMSHLGFSDGGRFLRWQQILEIPIPPCFSATLLASFFNFRGALKSLIAEGETLHYGRVTRPSAVFWAAFGDATESMALLLSKDYIDHFPLFRRPTDIYATRPSPLLEAVRLRENMESRPGIYPTAIMLLDHGCRTSDGFEIALLSSAPDSLGARELAERVLNFPHAFTLPEDSLGGIINYAVFAGQQKALGNLAAIHPSLKDDTAKITGKNPKLQESQDFKFLVPMLAAVSGRYERWISAVQLAGLNNDSRSIRLLCPSDIDPRHLANILNRAGINDWTPMHCAAQRGLEVFRQKKSGYSEWVTTAATTQAEDHGVNALLELSSDLGLADQAGDLPIHLAALQREIEVSNEKKARRGEWVTKVKTIQAGDHGINALLELSSDPGLADKAGNLPIHLAAYHGCEATVLRLSQCDHEWDRPNNEGKTPLAIALQLHHLEVAKTLLREGASLDKVSSDICRQFTILPEDASHEVKIEAQRPSWLFYAACIRSYTRRQNRPAFPLPIVARILRECEIFEIVEVERHDDYVFEQRTPGILSSRPVERLVIEARSGLGEWAWLRADKVEGSGSGRVVPWLDRRLFHRGKWGHADDTATFSDDSNAPDRAALWSLRPGDRVALVPVGIYPAWCVAMKHARIRLFMSGIRDCFSNQDRERIWKPQRMKRTVPPNYKQLQFFKNYGKDARGIAGIPFRHTDDCSSRTTKLPLRKV
ncbi:hypothetical protein Daus18300_000200 [Diaporthe australafricana]|uniref:Nephrocystin 3-like N-terminal domain-containing protein n=1 Tax=Diaporthe australafricana TaxID=127596 RepID=A0ABR3Y8T6_9PEZI